MYRKLFLGLTLSAIFAVTASAQSNSRGSSTNQGSSNAARANATAAANAAANERRLAKEADREYLKAAKQVAKKEFTNVKLTKQQLLTLKESVAANYQTMANIEKQINQSIPADKLKTLQRSYKKALRDGSDEMEAMSISMKAIGMSDTAQQQVMQLSKSKMDVMATVTSSITPTLTDEQKQVLAASKSKEMADKKMTEDKMAEKQGSGAKETPATMTKEMSGEEMTDNEGAGSNE